jgi:peptide/nickel transport system permease protein
LSPSTSGKDYVKISIELLRPDGQKITLLKDKKLKNETIIQIENNPEARKNIITWAVKNSGAEISPIEEFQLRAIADVIEIAFSQLNPEIFDNPIPLKGEYKLLIQIKLPSEDASVDKSNGIVLFNGRSFGLMGTDDKGRDLWAGLVWGTRVSLIIGVSVAVFSVLIGIFYGVTSGYFGGWVDEGLQRFNDFMYSLPVLPILILLGAYFKGHTTILTIVILLVVFGWVGIAKVARSMALQIKEQAFVEAARAMGASSWRIVLKHIIPQIMPYAFSQMALSVPGAVMTEAALSFLGLGDPTAVTWGQILYDAQRAGAVVNGYWWWVVPPGLAIALVGLSFVLIGVALDRILNPRLKHL